MTYRILTGSRRATFLALLILAGTTTRVAADDAKPSTEALAGIYGRVYAHDDKTKGLELVPGAAIELLDQAGKVVGQATSNDQGYYAIALKGGTYFYRVNAAGYREENSGRGFSLQLTEGDAVLNFTLERGTTDPNAKPPDLPKVTVGGLIGQVYEKTSTGKLLGVSGATVALRKVGSPRVLIVHTKAPVDGKDSGYELGSIEAGEWQITAWANGFDPLAPAAVTVRADDQRDHDILLIRPPEPNPVSPVQPGSGGQGTFGVAGLRGVISLADASPGHAPPIRATIHRAGTRTASDPIKLTAEGNYQVGCPPGRYVVRAEAEGYLPRDSEVSDVLSSRYTTVNLRLERRLAELLVKVFSAESKKTLGYATLRLRRPAEPLSKAATQNTDAAGQSLFKPIAAGDYQVLAGMAGFKPEGKSLQVRAGESNKLELYLTPDTTPTTLTVYVYDSEKRKLSEAAVQVRPAGQAALEGVTDSNGASQIKLVKPAPCVLTVSKPGHILQQRQVVLGSGENTQAFYLYPVRSPDPTLTLLVTSAKSKAPLPGVELRIQPALPKAPSLKTDASGAWNGTLPAPGRCILELTMKGYQPWKEEVVASAGNTTRRIPLVPLDDPSPKTGRFLISVIQAGDRAAVPGARVVMMPVRTESTERFDRLTDVQGKVTSSPLAPEAYSIAVEKEGYEPRKITATLTPGDHPGTIILTRKPSVTTPVPPKSVQLTLLILYPENKAPIAGVDIKIKRDGKDIKSGTSTAKGGYTCELPGPGAYTVTVTKPDYEPSQTSVDVTVPEVTRTIYLKAATLAKYTINVLVLEGEGKDTVPIEGADVKIRNKKQEVVKTGRTNNLGRFRAEDLEVGVYAIEASKAGYTQKERPTSDITRGTVQTQVPLFRTGGGTPKETPKKMNKHAAIVFTYATMKTGVSSGKLSLDEALKAARKNCGDTDPDSFGFNVYADEGDWCALAVGDNGVCGDGGKTAKQAKENALLYAAKRRITNARIVVCVNADGEKEVLVQPQDVQKLLKAIRYAAIAYSPSTKKTGVSAGKLNLDDAKKAAVKDCNANDALAVRWTYGARYCALAVADNGYATGTGEFAKEAQETALREAAKHRYTNPRIAVFVFSDDEKNTRTQPPPEVQKLLQQGRTAITAKNWAAAAAAINSAVKLAPQDADVLRAREEYNKAVEANQRQQAAQAAKQKEDQQQQQVQALLKQGRTAIAAKNWKAAADTINSASKLAPQDADVLRAKQEYDQAYAKAQKEDLARQKEEQTRQQEVQKLVQQCRTAIAAKNWQAAYNAINNASKLAPKDADVLRVKQEYDQAYARAQADTKAKPKDLYAVLAISKSTGKYGYSNRQPTLDDAKKAAIKNCNAADAEVYIWVQDGWLAFALGDNNGYGSGHGPTAEKAKENALRECNKVTTNGAVKLLVNSNE